LKPQASSISEPRINDDEIALEQDLFGDAREVDEALMTLRTRGDLDPFRPQEKKWLLPCPYMI
jgi:hypothetical protein